MFGSQFSTTVFALVPEASGSEDTWTRMDHLHWVEPDGNSAAGSAPSGSDLIVVEPLMISSSPV